MTVTMIGLTGPPVGSGDRVVGLMPWAWDAIRDEMSRRVPPGLVEASP